MWNHKHGKDGRATFVELNGPCRTPIALSEADGLATDTVMGCSRRENARSGRICRTVSAFCLLTSDTEQ